MRARGGGIGRAVGGGTGGGRRDVATFALSGLAGVVVLGVAGFLLVAHTATGEAIRDAKQFARLAGQGIVRPNLTPGVLRGDPIALARLDGVVRARVLRGPVVRVKIWTAAGRIIYSDEHALIGATYPLGEDELKALRTGRMAAEVSDLTRPENRFERRYHKLLEVYFPIAGPAGTPLLFETYQRFSAISSSSQHLLLTLVPALGGALLLLWAIQVPLAARLARRLRQGQREREELLRHAIESSELERRRVARDLHDGAVQNLSGIAWSLSAAALLKDAEPDELTRGIRAAARGESPLAPKAAQALIGERNRGPGAGTQLSQREREVLTLIARGYANKRIAWQLGIKEKTVKAHASSIFERLGVSDRTQAALWAQRHGVV